MVDISNAQHEPNLPDGESYAHLVSRFNELALQDERIAKIKLELQVGDELRTSVTLKTLLQLLQSDAEAAMLEFVVTNPADINKIIDLQSRVYAEVYIHKMLRRIRESGREAEAAIQAEEQGAVR